MQSLPVVRTYRDLVVWRKAISLVTEIYRYTQLFPKQKTYGLISQLKRAAISIPSNIAEGHARLTTGEYRQFLGHALGSLVEIETQLVISENLTYLAPAETNELMMRTDEIGKMLNAMLRSLSATARSRG